MLHESNTPSAGDRPAPSGHSLEFGLLGPFELRVDGRPVEIGSPKHRALLATLLLRMGQPVLIGELVESIWGDAQPGNPRRAVQLYVTRLRGLLAPSATEPLISTSTDGYRINIRPEHTDLGRFSSWLERATRAANRGDLDGEAAALAEALAQWRGKPLAGVPSDLLQREIAPRLREQWLQAVERRIDVELRRGRHADLVSELFALTAQHPLREPLWAQLMTALYRCDRRADALDAYHTARRHLADELGIDPGEELQTLYARILAGGTPPARDRSAPGPAVPRQLPADVPTFAGRAEDLVRLDGLLVRSDRRSTSTIVSVIAGTAGIGKTALAAHWARGVADRFPDGQLWVNLRGFDRGLVMTAGQALTRFLRALGVPDADIPLDVDDQAAVYRSLMDGRRMLVVLDNAASAEQVRPLLPGAPGSLVLVTSRSQLSGLVATEGAHPLVLDLLNHAEARELLARRLGAGRVRAEPSAVRDIVNLCARLPLALAIVAARAAAHPEFGLDALAAELRAGRGSLDAFAGVDPATEVRAVFSWSYQALSTSAARLFRLLSLHPGPDTAVVAVASLAGLTASQTRPLLVELANAHLVTEHTPGRYAFHDLMRAYATGLGLTEDPPALRREAQHRLFDHYLLTACAAAQTLPSFEPVRPAVTQPGVTVEDFDGHRQALLWLTTEHQVLLAVVEQAASTGFPAHAQQLAWTIAEYLYLQGHWHDWMSILQTALDIAMRPGGRSGRPRSHRGLARAYARLGRPDVAVAHGRLALELSEEFGDQVGLALSHRVFGVVLEVQGRLHEALGHDLRALELFNAIDHRAGQGRALNSIGWTYGQLGDYQQALSYCERALTLLTDLGDRQGQAATWDSLGYAHHHLGHHRRAIICYQRALVLLRDLGLRYKEAETLVNLGNTYDSMADTEAARAAWTESLGILIDLGHHEVPLVRTKLRNLGSAGRAVCDGPAGTLGAETAPARNQETTDIARGAPASGTRSRRTSRESAS